jgi:hypothetical protein
MIGEITSNGIMTSNGALKVGEGYTMKGTGGNSIYHRFAKLCVYWKPNLGQ